MKKSSCLTSFWISVPPFRGISFFPISRVDIGGRSMIAATGFALLVFVSFVSLCTVFILIKLFLLLITKTKNKKKQVQLQCLIVSSNAYPFHFLFFLRSFCFFSPLNNQIQEGCYNTQKRGSFKVLVYFVANFSKCLL